jgi:hypothetical protein
MNKFLVFVLLVGLLSGQSFAQDAGTVPTNLKESIYVLDHFLTDQEQESFVRYKEEDIVHAYNLTLGAYIRSHWGLNDDESKLYNFFEERGITHSHEMSNIILVSYHRVKTKKFINLEDQIEKYIGEKQLKKVRKKLNKAGKEI